MNQEKIGKFIASCRKECGYTQASLGEKLGITDRAVSKWETGKSMPDASIMLELCNLLNISVNELLTGEHIAMENYKEKAEENLLELQAKKVKARKSLFQTELVFIAIVILLVPVHLAINYYYPNNSGTGVGLLLVIIGIIMFGIHFIRNYEVKPK
ncbi:MAG: helix-turn-helix transcriptional regulator [Lachnospiraceae bacterium]|nr:helix-turn-helix transcriptional regulator [Lachnospiraceae bacterium]